MGSLLSNGFLSFCLLLRLEEAVQRKKREEQEKALAVKEQRKRKRAKLAAQATLSFIGEVGL